MATGFEKYPYLYGSPLRRKAAPRRPEARPSPLRCITRLVKTSIRKE